MEEHYDISEVCATLGTTSRTLRYYEQKGLITSAADPFSKRRKYTKSQIQDIKHVLLLRSLGLPLTKIAELKNTDAELRDIISEHRSRIVGLISEKTAQINLLEEALAVIAKGGDLFSSELAQGRILCSEEQLRIAAQCTDAILNGNFGYLMTVFSDDMKKLSSEESLRHSWVLTIKDIGVFEKKEEFSRDPANANYIYHTLSYEKLNVRIRYIFHGEEICGLWFSYAEKTPAVFNGQP